MINKGILKRQVLAAVAVLLLAGLGYVCYFLVVDAQRTRIMMACSPGKPDIVASCTKWIEQAPKNPSPYSTRAWAYFKAGKAQLALTDYNKALELKPGDAHNLSMRGSLFAKLKQYQRAIDDFTAVIAKKPIDRYGKSILRERAKAYEALKKYELAIADLTKAVSIDPKASWLIEHRTRLYLKVGKYDKALEDLKILMTKSKEPLLYFRRGQAFFGKKRYHVAIEDFSMAIEKAPRFTGAYLYRADAFVATGQRTKAIADLKVALRLDPTFKPAARVLMRLESEVSASQKAK